ncbi:adenine deaminase [Marininema halotolerans]|uniref:Adenine deaminase n=1 Tax=Marininema halotolerans TaxID=1155944 RepID=A0A1I6SUM1_9BACL|nr:adenine deaminase C-terminal domain-containing protein [Marininema halotolerans]SFS80570.1 adenine deaminase [Marininema halotolerans]
MDTHRIKEAIHWRRLIDTLLDPAHYADLVLKGGYVINVITREIYVADVAIKGEKILLVGEGSELTGPSTQVVDVTGKFVSPGFIDAHMHFESAMLTLTEFSRLSIPTGTTTLVADPHEIGNVLGVPGMKAMIEEAKTLPQRVKFTIPCRTPDAPGLETAGVDISAKDMTELMADPFVQGIGEIQGFSNVHPVYQHADHILDDQIASVAYAHHLGKTVEGNAPALFGKELAAHIISGGTHVSCHETTTKEEMVEKLRYGVTVFMREGSSQRNMAECIRAITEEGMDSRRAVLVSDDMVPEDLLQNGHMDDILRRTIACGVDPVEAIQMVTINPATHFGFSDVGVLAPGKRADVVVLSELENMTAESVYLGGKKVAEHGNLTMKLPPYTYPDTVKGSMKRMKVTARELQITVSDRAQARVRGIKVIPDQNLTGAEEFELSVKEGVIQPCLQRDVLPILVLERHGRGGGIGKTFVTGMTLKRGAIAESVAHDTHNVIVTGTNYEDMAMAANRVIAMGGGIAMIAEGKVVGDLPLPVGGLMTDQLSGKELADAVTKLHHLAREELGCTLHVPFMHLSFLSLVTSPTWKITDIGLVEVDEFKILPTVIQEGR